MGRGGGGGGRGGRRRGKSRRKRKKFFSSFMFPLPYGNLEFGNIITCVNMTSRKPTLGWF